MLDFEGVSDTKELKKRLFKNVLFYIYHHVQYQMSASIIFCSHVWNPYPTLSETNDMEHSLDIMECNLI